MSYANKQISQTAASAPPTVQASSAANGPVLAGHSYASLSPNPPVQRFMESQSMEESMAGSQVQGAGLAAGQAASAPSPLDWLMSKGQEAAAGIGGAINSAADWTGQTLQEGGQMAGQAIGQAQNWTDQNIVQPVGDAITQAGPFGMGDNPLMM